jgi:hypothetical protein
MRLFTRIPVLTFALCAFLSSSAILSAQDGLQFGPHVGLDIDTDAYVVGAQAIFGGLVSAVPDLKIEGVLSVGTGSYDYDHGGDYYSAAAKTGGALDDGSIDYNVIHIQGHARYPIPMGEDSDFGVEVLAGPAIYRWSQKDCDPDWCTDSEITIDVGAGVLYNMFGADAYIRLSGDVPDFSIRVKVLFGG